MINRRVFRIIFVIVVCFGYPVFTQEKEPATTRQASNTKVDLDAPLIDVKQNTMLANSSSDYLVTPGDEYTLSYTAGSSPVLYVIVVDTSYRIRVSNLGIVNGMGKTFIQLKSEVEAIVTNNYPLSGVQLVLTQAAVFRIHVKGEVYTTGEVSVWGLTRLSALAGKNLTDYASIRDISIGSSSGQTRTYDLFRAQRFGDLSQDPYLRPGDTVTFNQISRVVTINKMEEQPEKHQIPQGENLKDLTEVNANDSVPLADTYTSRNEAVERPGRYQLLPGENLKDLIEVYANGFTPMADTSRMELLRVVNSANATGDKIFLTNDDYEANYPLENFDEITVPTTLQLQPVMFIEGAVAGASETLEVQELSASNRLTIQFNKGETYASLIRQYRDILTTVSDTQNAYILRNGERIPVNLNLALYDAFYGGMIPVEHEDVLIIPFRQYFVSVSGAVAIPGRYPYIPDRDWEYYIGLAGGFIAEYNSSKSVTITDMNGRLMKKTDAIGPETVITANTNRPLFYFNQYAPVITTVLSILSSTLALWALAR